MPVNVNVGVAIDAHRQALKDLREPRTTYALRAVILAAVPTSDDIKRQLDYLTDLPDIVWASYGGPDIREATLRAITRSLQWKRET